MSKEEEELLAQLKKLRVDDVLLNTVVTLVNLSAHKLQDKDLEEAKKGIDAAREMLALCPQEQVAPIREALSQLQMAYVREMQGPEGPAEEQPEPEEPQKPKPDIWTPGNP
jgi:hypothetical protein